MFGLLLGLGVKLGANIAYAISDAKYMSTPVGKKENGDYYYINRAGDCIAQNGEKIIYGVIGKYADGRCRYGQYGANTGKIYCDPDARRQKQKDMRNEEEKQKAIECGELAYRYEKEGESDYGKPVTIELATGKCIGRLEYNQNGECRKYYLEPGETYLSWISGDNKGVIVTPFELRRLDAYGGGHIFDGKDLFYDDLRNGKFTSTEEELKEWKEYRDKGKEWFKRYCRNKSNM